MGFIVSIGLWGLGFGIYGLGFQVYTHLNSTLHLKPFTGVGLGVHS